MGRIVVEKCDGIVTRQIGAVRARQLILSASRSMRHARWHSAYVLLPLAPLPNFCCGRVAKVIVDGVPTKYRSWVPRSAWAEGAENFEGCPSKG